MTKKDPKAEIPEGVGPLQMQNVDELIHTLHQFCLASELPRPQQIGALEIVKHALCSDCMELPECEDGDEWKQA